VMTPSSATGDGGRTAPAFHFSSTRDVEMRI
jgi:hypothetical protein